MNIILMGPPGSGKSTQGDFLAEKLGIPHISTGEIFRTSSDPRIKDLLARGQLIDDETTYDVVRVRLATETAGFILDGFPRTLDQAKKELFPVNKVIYVNITDDEAVKRLSLRRRSDDSTEIICERLRIYHQETEPILDYYRQQNKLIEIDGSGTIEEVTALINQTL